MLGTSLQCYLVPFCFPPPEGRQLRREIVVSACFLQFLNFVVEDCNVNVGKNGSCDGHNGCVGVTRAVVMNEGAGEIRKLLFVKCAVCTNEISALRCHSRISCDGGAEGIDFRLNTLHCIDNAKAAGRSLNGEENIENEGISAVIVKAACGIKLIVFRGIEKYSIAEFAKMDNSFAAYGFLIIPIDNAGFITCINAVVIDIL